MNEQDLNYKLCAKCKVIKHKDDYAPSEFKVKSGRCKECKRKYYEAYAENGFKALGFKKSIKQYRGENPDYKICPRCKVDKHKDNYSISEFKKDNGWCRECKSISDKNYNKTHKEEKKIRDQKYREEHKEEIKFKKHEYYEENREKIKAQVKKRRDNNIEENREKSRKYYQENKESKHASNKRSKQKHKEKRRVKDKEYRENHKEERNEWAKNKRKNDPAYKLRTSISSIIARALKSNEGSKYGQSIMEHLPYTIEELKTYIEAQFSHFSNLTPDGKIWQNWDNWGIYIAEEWNDNDPSTWKWNLDHIIPQSALSFTSMEDENFQKCWSLSNLRTLSAKENVLKQDKMLEEWEAEKLQNIK